MRGVRGSHDDESYHRVAMAEPLAPHDIARHAFEVVRRGYDQQSVRAFLHEVSSLLDRLSRSERELRERAERAEARTQLVEHPDEAAMLELLGEETTRVLTSAKLAATEIRSKAEASAERLIADATAEAAATRSAAASEAEAARGEIEDERQVILEEARTELARRSDEAQAAADRIKEEASAAAEALREEGRSELEAARVEAAAAIDAAKAEGRSMIAEAQAVRERVLRDLQVRRKKARIQVEKLNAGRERLLEAYEVVRRTIDEANEELTVSLSDARAAADAAARRIEEEPEPTIEELDAEVSTAGLVDLPIAELDDEHRDEELSPGPFSGEVPAVEPGAPAPEPEQPPASGDDDAASAVTPITPERRSRRARRKKGFEALPPGELARVEPPDEDEGVRVLADRATEGTADEVAELEGGPAEPPEDSPPAEIEGEAAPTAVEEQAEASGSAEAGDDEPSTGSADDVFARLRAEQSDPNVEPAADASDDASTDTAPDDEAAEEAQEAATEAAAEATADDVPEGDAAAFAARDAALAPIHKELGRRLKRALADEQNEVLDLLRRVKPKGVDDLLPNLDEHAARWAEAARAPLGDAAAAGAAAAGGEPAPVDGLAADLAQGLVGPLRDRIDRSFAASDGNLDDVADRVRALYREWKGQRLTESAQHVVVAAYALGAFDALDQASQVRWTVDPSTPPCPDCDDNVLAGSISKGDDFPTGSPSAPAHTGCKCLVVPA